MTGGGTGGHVYPALSVAQALRRQAPDTQILFAGTRRGDVERLAREAGLPFVLVDAAPLRGRGPLAVVRALGRLAAGTLRARRLVARVRPDVVFATGGYASVPVSLAARWRRVPLVLYLPDVYPGWAVRLLARLSQRIALSGDAALAHLPRERATVTGYPVRDRFLTITRSEARATLGMPANERLLLVTGASQGAHAINAAVFACLERLLSGCLVLHQTGVADLPEAQARSRALPEALRERYRPLAYLDDMAAAMVAADLVVMRAGASALAEPPAAGLPAILVPGSFSDQRHNAGYMAAQGAALVLAEAHLDRLAETVCALLQDSGRLARMAEAARRLAHPDAAGAIARLVVEAAVA